MKWPLVKLSTFCTFKNGLNFSKENWGKGLKVIGVADFKDNLYPHYDQLAEINPKGVVKEGDYLQEGDILFVRSNGNRELIGRSLLLKRCPQKISHSGFTIRARLEGKDIYKPFYFYVFRSELIRATLSVYGGGTNINNLNQKILGNLDVPKPPLSEQKKIAAVLSAYDDLIENNKFRIVALEKIAEEIYREWFVRFRFPGYQTAEFEKGVPKGWNLERVDSIGKVVTGKTPSTDNSKFYGGDIHFVKTPDMHGQTFIHRTEEALSLQGLESQPSQIIPANSICVSCIGTGGVVSITTQTCSTNQQINSVIPANSSDLYWAFSTLRSLKPTILAFGATGATMTNLSKGKFAGLKVLAPPKELRKNFSETLEPTYEQIKVLCNSINILQQQKDLLLPRLISGKLSVDELDIQFPPSMQDEAEAELTK